MFLNALGVMCALGNNKADVLQHWLNREYSGSFAVTSELPAIAFKDYDCRNNRLLLAALNQIMDEVETAIQRYGSERIGIVLGTSTSGIAEGELAVATLQTTGAMPPEYHYVQQELGSAVKFLADYLNIQGVAYTVATTCSSSANALSSARRLLRLGVCDAVLVGGVDTLCRTTLEGFAALGAISPTRCNPFSKNRDGTAIGEAAALFLMSNEPSSIALLGVGTSSDAYHISAPRPDGMGAYLAMQQAVTDAGLTPEQVDYINLHGTATLQNDAMESLAVARLFGSETPCSSSKSVTGHCLGAAGAIEAALCWLLLSESTHEQRLPVQEWDGEYDSDLPRINLVGWALPTLRYCLSNSFSFGGNNVSLLIGRC